MEKFNESEKNMDREMKEKDLELANQLQGITRGTWDRLKRIIDNRFEEETRKLQWEVKLPEIKLKDISY